MDLLASIGVQSAVEKMSASQIMYRFGAERKRGGHVLYYESIQDQLRRIAQEHGWPHCDFGEADGGGYVSMRYIDRNRDIDIEATFFYPGGTTECAVSFGGDNFDISFEGGMPTLSDVMGEFLETSAEDQADQADQYEVEKSTPRMLTDEHYQNNFVSRYPWVQAGSFTPGTKGVECICICQSCGDEHQRNTQDVFQTKWCKPCVVKNRNRRRNEKNKERREKERLSSQSRTNP